ncbi:MAG: sigma-70 family RNA polymerase sigma factor [Terriglobales bacterium]
MRASSPTRNGFEASHELADAYGFVPNLFHVHGDLPRAVTVEGQLIAAVLLADGKLTRRQKEGLLYAVAGVRQSDYCLALYAQTPPEDNVQNRALLNSALKLARFGPWISAEDVEVLARAGFDDQAILEAVATTALGQMLCTLASALQPSPDPERSQIASCKLEKPAEPGAWQQPVGPYLKSQPQPPPDFAPFSILLDQLGFVPNLFRAQMLRPDLVAAEVHFFEQIMLSEDLLSRVQKEKILLAVSASNLSTYGVALQRQILDGLGVALEESDEIASDLRSAAISAADKALLNEVRKLNCARPENPDRFQAGALESHGFTKPQILEAIVVAAFANFLNTLQFGLGVLPDFPAARIFTPKDLYLSAADVRPTSDELLVPDPDAELVQQVQGGNVDVFEELVRRHSRRVFGTLGGILGNLDDARDATQDVFLKAFENISSFEGRAKFSTWLISIAINTGTEKLRRHKRPEPLEEGDDEDFRPRQVQRWADDPEQIFSAAQRNELVREGILRLPEKYRVALILRDINQLSTEEAAAALELSVPALKARVLRGRLMLRERLAPHFMREQERNDA